MSPPLCCLVHAVALTPQPACQNFAVPESATWMQLAPSLISVNCLFCFQILKTVLRIHFVTLTVYSASPPNLAEPHIVSRHLHMPDGHFSLPCGTFSYSSNGTFSLSQINYVVSSRLSSLIRWAARFAIISALKD